MSLRRTVTVRFRAKQLEETIRALSMAISLDEDADVNVAGHARTAKRSALARLREAVKELRACE